MHIQIFYFLAVCTFLAQNVNSELSSQQQCTVASVCGELSNILQKQDSLEKKVEEHGKILGGESCNNGKPEYYLYYMRKWPVQRRRLSGNISVSDSAKREKGKAFWH